MAATAAVAVLALGLAAGGLLPEAPQRVVVDVARTFGLDLPSADAAAPDADLSPTPDRSELVPADVHDPADADGSADGRDGANAGSEDAPDGPAYRDQWQRGRDHTEPPGRSEQAPGRPDDPGRPDEPGRSDEAPGRPESPGRSDDAPGGRSDDAPGRSDETGARTSQAPGRSEDDPGHSDDDPGRSDDAPGRSDDADPGGP